MRIIRRTVIVVGFFASLVLIGVIYSLYDRPVRQSVVDAPKPLQSATPSSTDTLYGLPLRLQIAKLGVDASISYMGLTASGEMDVPPDLVNVGWYKFGPKPGDTGSAVIAGHLEGTEDLGVFRDLNKLQAGDTVTVRNDRSETVLFTIRETRTYRQDDRPPEIFNRTDGSYLNLITCSGTWNDQTKRYSHRFVVFADKTTQ